MRIITRLLILITAVACSSAALAKEALRVGLSPDYPPLAYLDNGELSGIDVAAAQVIAKQLDRKVKFVQMPFAQLIPALEAGEIDIIMSGMTITPERSGKVAFSNPYLDAGQMAIIRFADAAQFGFKGALFRPGARVAVQGDTTSEQFAAQYLKNAEVTRCNSTNEAFALLKSGKVDFLVHDAATSWALATDKDKQDLMSLNHHLTDEKLGWAMRKDNTALLQTINEQLAMMQKNGTLRAIVRGWIPVTVEVEDNSRKATGSTSRTPTQSTRNGTQQ